MGDRAPYLTENMEVQLQSFEGRPISIEIPQRATFEVVETEPVMKGQTASGSFKPALLSNGVRTMVPTQSCPAPASWCRRKTAPTWNGRRSEPRSANAESICR